MRSAHSLAFRQFEEVLSDIKIKLLSTEESLEVVVVSLCEEGAGANNLNLARVLIFCSKLPFL